MRQILVAFLFILFCNHFLVVSLAADWPVPRSIDSKKFAEAGLRILRSEHCTLVTDLPSSAEVDRLPTYIDQAIMPWSKRFNVKSNKAKDWRLRVYLMQDRSRFDSLNLMPVGNDQFTDGYAYGYEAWLYEQPTNYYRRHLLLHEGTHSFMMTHLGSCGPSWYMEAMAELCGTHRFDDTDKTIQIASFPSDKKEVPHWGRVRLVRNQVSQNGLASIPSLMRIDNRRALQVESYAWLWALAKFLDSHPRYQERWRSMISEVNHFDFDGIFEKEFADDRLQLEKEWRWYQKNLEYGHDISREAIDFVPGVPIGEGDVRLSIAADRGWQSSRVLVEKGKRYRVDARGEFVVGKESDGRQWISEANGISLSYYDGQPLGRLIAVIDNDSSANWQPFSIGYSNSFLAEKTGTLFLRINNHPSELAENRGSLAVRVAID